MHGFNTLNDNPIVAVRNNNTALALKFLRQRMRNAEIYKHHKVRRKNTPSWRKRKYRSIRAEEQKVRKRNWQLNALFSQT
jgi:hypothetical protein